jgi:anthranilate phosphoribosyltransferase
MKNVAPVRRALKVKTFFNMLGPMVNPARPGKQLVGVYSLDLARLYNYLYQQSGVRYAIVHSLDGYDEVSLTGDFKYILNGVETIISPESFGYPMTNAGDLNGGRTVQEAADIFISVLQGNGTGAQNHVVIANTQMALMCYSPDISPDTCRKMAEESLESGKAFQAFNQLIAMQS